MFLIWLYEYNLFIKSTRDYLLSDTQGRTLQKLHCHLQEKYAEGGYLKLWFPCSPNADRLKALRVVICSEQMLRKHFEKIYREESL